MPSPEIERLVEYTHFRLDGSVYPYTRVLKPYRQDPEAMTVEEEETKRYLNLQKILRENPEIQRTAGQTSQRNRERTLFYLQLSGCLIDSREHGYFLYPGNRGYARFATDLLGVLAIAGLIPCNPDHPHRTLAAINAIHEEPASSTNSLKTEFFQRT